MSSLTHQLNPTALDELCSIQLYINKANGKRNCKHCNKLMVKDKYRFELRITPKPASLLKNGESLHFHLSCWLNIDNKYKNKPFNYKHCIGWNKLKRTIQNDILRINVGYQSFYGMSNQSISDNSYSNKNEQNNDNIEPPKKKRKLQHNNNNNNNKYNKTKIGLKKKRNFKPPRMIKEKNEIENKNTNMSESESENESENENESDIGSDKIPIKKSINLNRKRITNQMNESDSDLMDLQLENEKNKNDNDNDIEIDLEDMKKDNENENERGKRKIREKNDNMENKQIQCQIFYTREQGTQTMPLCIDLNNFDGTNKQNEKKEKEDLIPWDDICSDTLKKTDTISQK